MTHQELRQLKSGALIKIKSQIFLWKEKEWDGIEERNAIFLKHLGENTHICRDNWAVKEDLEIRNKRKESLGTTSIAALADPVYIIQLLTDGNIITIEACPDFIQEIKCSGDSSSQ